MSTEKFLEGMGTVIHRPTCADALSGLEHAICLEMVINYHSFKKGNFACPCETVDA